MMSDTKQMCFGLNRSGDERSLAEFLRLFADKRLTNALIPRMTDEEILQTIDFLTGLMRTHFNEKEYHELFLGERDPHDLMNGK